MIQHQTVIRQTDPQASYLAHKAEIDAAISRVLDSGWYVLGGEVQAFEKEFASYLGVSDAIGVANGTDALAIALRALDIGFGDAVITVSHTAVATVAAIELVGATPVLVDVDTETYNLDLNHLEDTIRRTLNSTSQKTRLKAIIPVHLYGYPADLKEIIDLARRYELYVVEDCAQSHGAEYMGHKTGSLGDLAAFSFYPTKNLGALGDGGAVVTNDVSLAQKVRSLREYGWQERYISSIPGMNTRLDELQASILRVKLRYLDHENSERQQLARRYNQLLSTTSLVLPYKHDNADHVYHQYVVRSQKRDELRAYLKEHGISTLIHYPVPIHLQPAYQNRIFIPQQKLKNTERVSQEIFSLPMHPHLTIEQVQQVSEMITLWHKQKLEKD
ncbi:DegT/DnrJ/EryC1/StrS family aminotransferase [Aetokthonos hydrillicola Thurmond2011]|jgi:dTDP-4-amino-4,6-dideoxygalactose transaminase|uniref:DegT/DnrJ/EryC1/StrS family aminotransferase n=1 Tax=Aetokthonos hydrillicola Thurmond2011 TaxID=2712845 RepID=A0AAP5I4Y8_9CYAN|nr:DegT/DnrJ/EryC1/StrS family aminotransferase [Aetokthonos hydrillicola]MDR9894881.1 DegT/DnrJ/EryC1/StrS family aminotransferase [Aetokthonos hydrillicola Thurmond2011]